MSLLNRNKISELIANWPTGAIMTSRWLLSQGYSAQLLQKYLKNGWINLLGKGAYTRLKESVTWVGGINALQTQLKLSLHLGGVSALEWQGLGHNIAFKNDTFYLYKTTAHKRKLLPRWFLTAFPHAVYYQNPLFSTALGVDTITIQALPIQVSVPERAILEVLSLVPHAYDYEDALNLVENCQLLRVEVLQQLLVDCLSIKAKRLFLYFADYCSLPSFKELDVSKFDLGTGSRTIGEGGHFVSAYQLVVPRLPEHEGVGDV